MIERSHVAFLPILFAVASCSNASGGGDGGGDFSGPPIDAARTIAADAAVDAAVATDASRPRDASVLVDATQFTDATRLIDASVLVDATTLLDASVVVDATVPVDLAVPDLTCQPATCAGLGIQCGNVSDQCNGILQCGSCNQPQTCGGGGVPNVCSVPASCTGLCLQQVTCANPNVSTTVSGTVLAPNGVDPLVSVLVYVPNGTVQPFKPNVACDICGAPASDSPLVQTVTTVDGTFTLTNVPVGANIPLVIQTGRWRRQVTIPNVVSCTDTPVASSLTRLPRNQGEGDIPLMAFATGYVDALECVLRKVGVDDAEFTAPGGGGRCISTKGSPT
jgi:hypothetical protein